LLIRAIAACPEQAGLTKNRCSPCLIRSGPVKEFNSGHNIPKTKVKGLKGPMFLT